MNTKPVSSGLILPKIAICEPQLAPPTILKNYEDKWNIIDKYKQTNIFGHQNVLYIMQNNKTGKLKSIEFPNKIF